MPIAYRTYETVNMIKIIAKQQFKKLSKYAEAKWPDKKHKKVDLKSFILHFGI